MIRAESPEQELATWLFSKYLLAPNAQAELVKSLFSLPVRTSAMELLMDFKVDYPQWAQGAALIDSANTLPVSGYWGTAQWALQDAANRILQAEEDNVTLILEQLDDLIVDLVEGTP